MKIYHGGITFIPLIKLQKNIGLLYQEKYYLDDNCLKKIYFAYIRAYLNYGNAAWASTHKTKKSKVNKNTLYV